MIPVVQHNPNFPSSAPLNVSTSQQVLGNPTNILPNLMQNNSQLGFGNPQQSMPYNNNNNPTTHMGNPCPPGLMNFPQFNPLQNGNLGNPFLGSVPQNFVPNSNVSVFPNNGQLGNLNQGQVFGQNLLNAVQQLNQVPGFQNGQLGWQNQAPNINQLGNMQMLNPSQIAALAQLIGCAANQVAQGMTPQSNAFVGNPQQQQLTHVQPNIGQQLPTSSQRMQGASFNPQHSQPLRMQSNMGQQMPTASQHMQGASFNPQHNQSPRMQNNMGQQLPTTSQHVQSASFNPQHNQSPIMQNNMGQQLPTISSHMQSASFNLQHNQSPRMQGDLGKMPTMHSSNSDQHQKKNFLKNQQGGTNQRFQKSRNHHMQNAKGNHTFSDKTVENGAKSSGLDNSANSSKSGKKRSLSMFYTEKEIQQWREERKKNFPSQNNVEKKLQDRQANADAAVKEAELRRQSN